MTERAEHTAGTWSVYNNSTSNYGLEVVADVKVKAKRVVCRVGGPDREARARLIAAAPDLMAALKDLLTVCEKNIYPQPDKSDSAWAKLQAARAAIARATGEA